MGWFSKKRGDRAQKPRNARWTAKPPKQSSVFLTKIDEIIARAERLRSSADSAIRRDFERLSEPWGCEAIFVVDTAAIRELLRKVAEDDLAAGFAEFRVVSSEEDNQDELHYVQLCAVNYATFRPYRIVRWEDGRLACYGHTALYQAKRALDRAAGIYTPSTKNLIDELIAIGRLEGTLFAPERRDLTKRIQEIGSVLDGDGGMGAMRQVHAAVRQSLGPGYARELEYAWDGIGGWLR